MEFRNAKFNQYGSIDCEILTDEFGWLPFTATEDDIYSVSHEIFYKAKETASPYVPPSIEETLAEKAEVVRFHRNMYLSSCDWTQVADAPVDKAAWAIYRQALRDITSQKGFPENVVWPTKPE